MLVRWRTWHTECSCCEEGTAGFYDVTTQCGVFGIELCRPCAEAISKAVTSGDDVAYVTGCGQEGN